MKKLTLIAGVAIGYVLGSRAGRERYEQIKSGAGRVAHNPKVQAVAGKAQVAAKDKVTDVASTAADKVRRETSIQAAP